MNKKTVFFICMILAISLYAGMPGAAQAQEGQQPGVNISTSLSAFGAGDDVVIQTSIANNGTEAIHILKWFTPASENPEPLFSITLNGQPVEYTGPHYNRIEPSRESYITIEPGQSLSGEINLAGKYDFSQSGEYQVTYDVFAENLFLEQTGSRIHPQSGSLISDAITLQIEGRTFSIPQGDVNALAVVGNTTFNSCSVTRQTYLINARNTASTYAADAVKYFSNGQQGKRYTYWFGTYNSTRYNTVKNHYSKIKNAVDNANPMNFNCSCTDANVYAYVYPGQPYKIYLCGAFWASPNGGKDSRAGTLIHEISHFTVVAGTDDVTYGYNPSHNLAVSNPSKAIINADNHEYFAENTPSLETTNSGGGGGGGGGSTGNANYLQDGGFEAYTSSPWAQTSTNYGTPLCKVADCGSGGDSGSTPNHALPRNGSAWAWFGGIATDESGSLTQTVTFPSGGSAYLRFYFWVGYAGAGSDTNDVFNVKIDGNTVFSANATQTGTYPSYTLVSIPVGSYANGAPHMVRIDSTTTAQYVSFSVDDVSLTINDAAPSTAGTQSTVKSTNSYDGWILESSESSNTGGTLNSGATTLLIGDDGGNRQYRSILSFDTSGLPDGATVTDVTLKIKKNKVVNNPFAALQGLMVDVKKGAFSGNILLSTSDFRAKANKVLGPFTPTLSSGWYSISLNAGSYINKTGTTQIRLRFKLDDNNNHANNYLKIYSGNASSAYRPQLIISYSQ